MPNSDPRLQTLIEAAVPFALPLRRRFRDITTREGMLIRGPHGWGEFAPFDDYSDAAAARWLGSAVEAAFGTWPAARRRTVPVNAIIPAVDSGDAASLAREAVLGHGCRTVKIKVGDPDLADDEARVASVRDVLDTILGRSVGAIRIDANGAWNLARATTAMRRLGAYRIEYVEQPCRTPGELLELRRVIDVPIAVDEILRTSNDPGSVRVAEYADVAVVKPAPLGGVTAALRVIESLDVPVVISGSLDSSVGLDVAVATAAAVADLPYACGFGTGSLLAADVVDETRVPFFGELLVGRTMPALPALVAARDRLPEARAAYWRERLIAAWHAGAAGSSGSLIDVVS